MSDDNIGKQDPERTGPSSDPAAAMRLRAKPPQVTRLSRRALLAAGLIVSLGIGGALIYALRPPDRNAGGEELYTTDNRRTAEGLEDLPRDYTGPVLGPPLPGDLGRPILNAQERGQPVAPPVIAPPAADPEEQPGCDRVQGGAGRGLGRPLRETRNWSNRDQEPGTRNQS